MTFCQEYHSCYVLYRQPLRNAAWAVENPSIFISTMVVMGWPMTMMADDNGMRCCHEYCTPDAPPPPSPFYSVGAGARSSGSFCRSSRVPARSTLGWSTRTLRRRWWCRYPWTTTKTSRFGQSHAFMHTYRDFWRKIHGLFFFFGRASSACVFFFGAKFVIFFKSQQRVCVYDIVLLWREIYVDFWKSRECVCLSVSRFFGTIALTFFGKAKQCVCVYCFFGAKALDFWKSQCTVMVVYWSC